MLVDAEAKGRVRKVGLVPVSAAIAALTSFGRTEATTAILNALKSLPKRWAIEIQQEVNRQNDEHNSDLDEELKELDKNPESIADVELESMEMDLITELILDFEPYAEVEEDSGKVGKLSTLSSALKKELAEWKVFRSSSLNRLRTTPKVAEVTHEHEVANMLRFFGYLHIECEVREPTMKQVFRAQDVGAKVEQYGRWLESRQLKWSTISNYLAALISAATFANVENESPPDLTQLTVLRKQAESYARIDTRYRPRDPNWLSWPEVQKTRVAVIEAYNAAEPRMKTSLLKDVVVIMLHSVTPPDRVGVSTSRLCYSSRHD